MDPLDVVYSINQRIKELQEEIEVLREKSSRPGQPIDSRIEHRIDSLQMKVNELVLKRTRELKRVRWEEKRKPKVAPAPVPVPEVIKREPSPEPVVVERASTPVPIAVQSILAPTTLKVSDIYVGDDATTLTMTPTWFKPDNEEAAVSGIVYPDGDVDRDQLVTVARFRAVLGQSRDFILHPLNTGETSVETLILSLDAFARQFGGQLSFTHRELSFEDSAEGAACGIPNLGSAHLLANERIPTAYFSFTVTLDYDKELARSAETMETFVLNFATAIAHALGCKGDYVRVFSIQKSKRERGKVQINFGLTTANEEDTQLLAVNLQDMARSGFGDNEVLRLVELREYEYKWRSVLSYLELKPSDFDPRFNFDYTRPGLPEQQQRANQPYFLPLGWYRHALDVSDKYADESAWLGHNNSSEEWPVAYHGTHFSTVGDIAQHGLSTEAGKRDRFLEEAIQQKGAGMNRSGLCLATHCNGGAEGDATTFQVQNGDQMQTFQVVFQCRVQPDSFTIHTAAGRKGHIWRVVDPAAIRPYGLLLRRKDI